MAVTQLIQFSNEDLDLMRKTVARGATPDQFSLFLAMCRHYALNPLARQIYCIIDKSGRMTVQTSIDGFRLMAERTNKYAGQLGPLWCDEDGVWVDVWLKKTPPAAAKVGILRRDFEHPIWGVARHSSYAQDTPTWRKMGDLMLAKCAESLAFRRAFPAQMGGLYTQEEMEQAKHSVSVDEMDESVVEARLTAQIAEKSIEKQIGEIKRRAVALGAASNAQEWAGLLDHLDITEITSPDDIAKVHEYLDGLEQPREQEVHS